MRKSFPITLSMIIVLLVFACRKTTLDTSSNSMITSNDVSTASVNNSYIDSFSSINHNGDNCK